MIMIKIKIIYHPKKKVMCNMLPLTTVEYKKISFLIDTQLITQLKNQLKIICIIQTSVLDFTNLVNNL